MKKQKIAVYCDKKFVTYIFRKIWAESIGNFNPIFCRYNKDNRCLVQSTEGDLSDPFRRDETYLTTLYIDIDIAK